MVVVTEVPIRSRVGRPVTVTEARAVLKQLGRATRQDLQDALRCNKSTASDLMKRLVAIEAARDTGTFAPARGGRQGRPSAVFEFVPWVELPEAVDDHAVAAVELQSGFALPDLRREMTPVKRIGTPLTGGCVLSQPTPKPRKPRVGKPSNGHKTKRRKGKLGVDDMLKTAAELGYEVTETKKRYRFTKPGVQEVIFGAKNPSDWRTVKNVVAHLARAA